MDLIESAIRDAGAQIITLAVRRTNTKKEESILDHIPEDITLLPNTSGARNADEAVSAGGVGVLCHVGHGPLPGFRTGVQCSVRTSHQNITFRAVYRGTAKPKPSSWVASVPLKVGTVFGVPSVVRGQL